MNTGRSVAKSSAQPTNANGAIANSKEQSVAAERLRMKWRSTSV
jgi:hypothetical protein